MKKMISLLLIVPFFFSCSSDEEKEESQDYTSFVFYQSVDNTLPNCVAAYKKNNKYYKLGDLGELSKGKYSPEIRIDDNSINEVYFFTDYNNVVMFDMVYKLSKNKKNIFSLTEDVKGIGVTDKTDPTQYPQ